MNSASTRPALPGCAACTERGARRRQTAPRRHAGRGTRCGTAARHGAGADARSLPRLRSRLPADAPRSAVRPRPSPPGSTPWPTPTRRRTTARSPPPVVCARLEPPRKSKQHPRGLSLGGARLVRLVRPAWLFPSRRRCRVAAFLAAERDRGLTPNTLDLRRAAIRYLHHAAGCASPTDEALVGETLAGIRRAAPNPAKKRAATLAVLRGLLAPIPDDLPGRRDRALILVGFAGALRRSELAAIALADLLRTDQGFELTLPRSKGAQTAAVTVPLPYGRTSLLPGARAHRLAGRRPYLPTARCSGGSGPAGTAGAPPSPAPPWHRRLTPRSIAADRQGARRGGGV